MTPDSAFFEHAHRVLQFMTRTQVGGVVAAQAVAEEFNQLALDGFALQWERNPVYQRWCRAVGVDAGSVRHWKEIPALPTTAFKEFEVTCLSPAERTVEFQSSGTTEQVRGRHFHCQESLRLYEASLIRWFNACVQWRPSSDSSLIVLTPRVPGSSLAHMFEKLRWAFVPLHTARAGFSDGSGAWTVETAIVIEELERICGLGASVMIFGTAFNYVNLLDDLAAKGRTFELPAGSLVLETGGYKGRSRALPKAELHEMIARHFGVDAGQIVCEYGMCELSSQAYELPGTDGTRAFHFPPWARISILSPESGREVAEGEIGLLCIHDLANVWSASALRTQDLARRRGEGFELLGRATDAEARGCSLMSLDR